MGFIFLIFDIKPNYINRGNGNGENQEVQNFGGFNAGDTTHLRQFCFNSALPVNYVLLMNFSQLYEISFRGVSETMEMHLMSGNFFPIVIPHFETFVIS